MTAVACATALAMIAIAIRLGIHVGARPGGVDTWYYLVSADAVRQRRRLPVHLPRYLLHDSVESYPPGFHPLLAAMPSSILRRWFWVIAPAIDTAHLLFVLVVTLRLTGALAAVVVGGGVYALTPHLIAETRSP